MMTEPRAPRRRNTPDTQLESSTNNVTNGFVRQSSAPLVSPTPRANVKRPSRKPPKPTRPPTSASTITTLPSSPPLPRTRAQTITSRKASSEEPPTRRRMQSIDSTSAPPRPKLRPMSMMPAGRPNRLNRPVSMMGTPMPTRPTRAPTLTTPSSSNPTTPNITSAATNAKRSRFASVSTLGDMSSPPEPKLSVVTPPKDPPPPSTVVVPKARSKPPTPTPTPTLTPTHTPTSTPTPSDRVVKVTPPVPTQRVTTPDTSRQIGIKERLAQRKQSEKSPLVQRKEVPPPPPTLQAAQNEPIRIIPSRKAPPPPVGVTVLTKAPPPVTPQVTAQVITTAPPPPVTLQPTIDDEDLPMYEVPVSLKSTSSGAPPIRKAPQPPTSTPSSVSNAPGRLPAYTDEPEYEEIDEVRDRLYNPTASTLHQYEYVVRTKTALDEELPDYPKRPVTMLDEDLPAPPPTKPVPMPRRQTNTQQVPHGSESESQSEFDEDDEDADDTDGEEAGWTSEEDDEQEEEWQSQMVAEANRNSTLEIVDDEQARAEREKKGIRRLQISQEILTTEESYVDALSMVQNHFIQSIQASSKPLLSEETFDDIFLNSDEIFNLHSGIVAELNELVTDADPETLRIGKFFCNIAPYLHIYFAYTTNFEKSAKLVKETMSKNPGFAEVLNICHQDKRCKMKTLGSFMLEPVQRIPRYKLLLEEYQSKLPAGHVDELDTQQAVQLMRDVATSVNENIRQRESEEELQHLQEKFPQQFVITKKGRSLTTTTTMQKICRKGPQKRVFFLFSDCLVYCGLNPTTKGYISPKMVPFDSIKKVSDIEGSMFGQAHLIAINGNKKSFMFACDDISTKLVWVRTLEEALAVQMDATTIVSPYPREVNGDDDDVFTVTQAPLWIPDKGVSMCQLCSIEFNFVRRRHHCRVCGKVVCGPCSPSQIQIAYMGNKLGRACDECACKIAANGIGNVVSKRQQKIQDTVAKKRNVLQEAANGLTASEDKVMGGFMSMKQGGFFASSKRSWYVLKKNFVLYSYRAPEDIVAVDSTPMPGLMVLMSGNKENVFYVDKRNKGGGVKRMIFEVDGDIELRERWMKCLDLATRAEAEKEEEVETPLVQNNRSPQPGAVTPRLSTTSNTNSTNDTTTTTSPANTIITTTTTTATASVAAHEYENVPNKPHEYVNVDVLADVTALHDDENVGYESLSFPESSI